MSGKKGKKPSPAPAGGAANLCVFCCRAYGGCSWSEFDPMADRPRFQPVPGWTAEPAKLFQRVLEPGESRYTDTWHITACPLFIPDRPGQFGKPGQKEAAPPRAQTQADAGTGGGRKTMKRKPRLCSRFYCGSRKGRFCCADCRRKRKCENSCLNDPSRCGLEDKTRR